MSASPDRMDAMDDLAACRPQVNTTQAERIQILDLAAVTLYRYMQTRELRASK